MSGGRCQRKSMSDYLQQGSEERKERPVPSPRSTTGVAWANAPPGPWQDSFAGRRIESLTQRKPVSSKSQSGPRPRPSSDAFFPLLHPGLFAATPSRMGTLSWTGVTTLIGSRVLVAAFRGRISGTLAAPRLVSCPQERRINPATPGGATIVTSYFRRMLFAASCGIVCSS